MAKLFTWLKRALWPAISSCIRIRIRIRTRMWIRYRNRNGTRNRRGLLRKFLMNELTFCWPVYGKVQYCLPSAYTQIKSTCPLSYPLSCHRLWLIRYKSKVRLTWNWKLVSKKFATRHNHSGQLSRDKKRYNLYTVHSTWYTVQIQLQERDMQGEKDRDICRYVCGQGQLCRTCNTSVLLSLPLSPSLPSLCPSVQVRKLNAV